MDGEERLGLPEPFDDDQIQFLRELEALHSQLTQEERDELLQGLLTAAPRGGEAMTRILEMWLLDAAARELIDSFRED